MVNKEVVELKSLSRVVCYFTRSESNNQGATAGSQQKALSLSITVAPCHAPLHTPDTFAHGGKSLLQPRPTVTANYTRIMLPCLNLSVVLCVLQVFCITADIDTSSFLIFNEDHNKCVKVESATSITVDACDPHAKDQQFRWVSESHLLSLSLKLCLSTTAIEDWVKVQLMECDESNDLQHWQCKNDTLFGLKDQDLHLNWGNYDEKSVMIYKGSGIWSRWRIYGTQEDLCSKGYQEIFTLGGNAFGAACQFPFKFHKKWYAECTKDGRTDGQLWCATERDYDKVLKWGFCPTRGIGFPWHYS